MTLGIYVNSFSVPMEVIWSVFFVMLAVCCIIIGSFYCQERKLQLNELEGIREGDVFEVADREIIVLEVDKVNRAVTFAVSGCHGQATRPIESFKKVINYGTRN